MACPDHLVSLDNSIAIIDQCSSQNSSTTMILPIVERRDSHFDSATLHSEVKAAQSRDEAPKTLFGLLQRAADRWPTNGIAIKDKGWDKESTFLTYAGLVKEAKVIPAHSPIMHNKLTSQDQRSKTYSPRNSYSRQMRSHLLQQPPRQCRLVLVGCRSGWHTCSTFPTIKQRDHRNW